MLALDGYVGAVLKCDVHRALTVPTHLVPTLVKRGEEKFS